jgi:competence protein ComEA
MAALDPSVQCTVQQRRRSMGYVRVLVILLAVVGAWSMPALAGVARADAVTVAAADAKVNINTADVNGLMKLQGVGRSLAEKIVQYRDTNGPFKKAVDLRKVEGVGDGLWEKNRARIVVK